MSLKSLSNAILRWISTHRLLHINLHRFYVVQKYETITSTRKIPEGQIVSILQTWRFLAIRGIIEKSAKGTCMMKVRCITFHSSVCPFVFLANRRMILREKLLTTQNESKIVIRLEITRERKVWMSLDRRWRSLLRVKTEKYLGRISLKKRHDLIERKWPSQKFRCLVVLTFFCRRDINKFIDPYRVWNGRSIAWSSVHHNAAHQACGKQIV